ncbi:DUF2207 domain-containing protein [Chitinophaga sp. MM2321]|uniref:DUF2207 domain-containing protein n=1 Tax=Chitinophaga sp. MM2321 TaxID=3137178 RepID=UPI0032D59E6D
MKRVYFILFFLFESGAAFAQGFIVKDLTADIYLSKEGYFDVVEKYNIEFTEAKHGIFREIITDYKLQTTEGKTENRKLVIENLEVPGYNFSTNYKIEQRTDGKIKIKIGDKNKLVTGLQHYEIKYRVYNAFLFEHDLAQFYWNIKPQGWLAVFQKINFNIHVPEGVVLSPENCFVYAGNTGTTSPSVDFDYSYSDGVFVGKSHDFFISVPGQDVTVLIKLPKNLIKENFITVPLWQQYGWVGILGFLLFVFWLVWLKYGKDDIVISTTSYYPPKDIDPAMAGYLIDDKGDTSDLIALIPQWASQGFITIEEIPKSSLLGKADMKLTRLNTIPVTAPDYEQRLFSTLFGIWRDTVLIGSLRNTFYVTMNEAKKELKAKAQKYYEVKSNKVMKITMGVAITLGVLLCPLFLFVFGVVAAVSAPFTCVFIALMSFFLQKKNKQGNAIFSELKGFKQFIKMAEVSRIKTLIEQDEQYFEKTMSYALAFGLLGNWAKKFDALNIPPPTWYSSSGTHMMGMYAFSKSFSGSMATAQSSMVSSPSGSRSGGGSSGGGFGGGGGGSW